MRLVFKNARYEVRQTSPWRFSIDKFIYQKSWRWQNETIFSWLKFEKYSVQILEELIYEYFKEDETKEDEWLKDFLNQRYSEDFENDYMFVSDESFDWLVLDWFDESDDFDIVNYSKSEYWKNKEFIEFVDSFKRFNYIKKLDWADHLDFSTYFFLKTIHISINYWFSIFYTYSDRNPYWDFHHYIKEWNSVSVFNRLFSWNKLTYRTWDFDCFIEIKIELSKRNSNLFDKRWNNEKVIYDMIFNELSNEFLLKKEDLIVEMKKIDDEYKINIKIIELWLIKKDHYLELLDQIDLYIQRNEIWKAYWLSIELNKIQNLYHFQLAFNKKFNSWVYWSVNNDILLCCSNTFQKTFHEHCESFFNVREWLFNLLNLNIKKW